VGRFALARQDGEAVVVPERIDQPAQLIDVADLAEWLLRAGLSGMTGIVDAYGPRRTLREVIDVARDVAGFTGEVVPLSDTRLVAAGIEEFMGPRSLALWLHDPEWAAFSARSTESAERARLRSRDLAETTGEALATRSSWAWTGPAAERGWTGPTSWRCWPRAEGCSDVRVTRGGSALRSDATTRGLLPPWTGPGDTDTSPLADR